MVTSRSARPETPRKHSRRASRVTAKSIIDLAADEDEPNISPAAPKKRTVNQACHENSSVAHTTKKQKIEHDFSPIGVIMTGKGNIYIRNGHHTKKLQNQSRASLDERLQEWLLQGLPDADAIRIHIKLRDTSCPARVNHMLYLLSSVLAESESKKPRKVRLTLRSDIPMHNEEIARLLSPIARLDKTTELELCGISLAVTNKLSAELVFTRSGTALNDWRQLHRKVEDFLAIPAAKALGWYKAKVWRDKVLGRKPCILDEKMVFDCSNEVFEEHPSQKISECRIELDREWQEFWE